MHKLKTETLEHAVYREIITNYGERYGQASLANVSFPTGTEVKIIDFMKNPKNFLVICGNPGIGKTYICAAMTEWVLKTFNTSRYWNEKKLHTELKDSFNSNWELLDYLIDDDLIIYDDIGSEGFSEWKERVLTEVIDFRY